MNDTTTAESTAPETRIDPAAACSLTGGEMDERLAWIRAEILPHAVGSERTRNGVVWELEDAPGLVANLGRLVALEADCCPGVRFEHTTDPASGRRRLQIDGVDPDSEFFATPPAASEPPGIRGRLAKAAGLGTIASLLVCCVFPLSVAATFGTAAATDLVQLENPIVLAGMALLFGAALFVWLGRRRATGSACSC